VGLTFLVLLTLHCTDRSELSRTPSVLCGLLPVVLWRVRSTRNVSPLTFLVLLLTLLAHLLMLLMFLLMLLVLLLMLLVLLLTFLVWLKELYSCYSAVTSLSSLQLFCREAISCSHSLLGTGGFLGGLLRPLGVVLLVDAISHSHSLLGTGGFSGRAYCSLLGCCSIG